MNVPGVLVADTGFTVVDPAVPSIGSTPPAHTRLPLALLSPLRYRCVKLKRLIKEDHKRI